jgi:peptide/nickel transport system substrate-binding protein
MRRISLILLIGLLFASCVPQPVPVSTNTPSPTAIPPVHAPQIRFALIGGPQDINVWQLFDESGASYADYALRSEYWPRLYHLAPPQFDFQPLAAESMPSAAIAEGNGYSASISLRGDLTWTDGSLFTADDVAFTVNTALQYELGYDWSSYYDGAILDRVEALDAQTVKFYFNQKPDVSVWQYGALQGPIVQKAFWESKISDAATFLPDEKINSDIEAARAYRSTVEARINEIVSQINQLVVNGKHDRQLASELVKRQDELEYANSSLNDLLEERAAQIESAQQGLYAVDDIDEPVLGPWIPAGEKDGVWINKANPDFQLLQPHFEEAQYLTYADAEDAYSAFANDQVDVLLIPDIGLQAFTLPAAGRRGRFLVFNPNQTILLEQGLRKALACIFDPAAADLLQGDFVSSAAWKNSESLPPCRGLSREGRIENAVGFLKDAGYIWSQIPDAAHAGSGLKLPDGTDFPRITLLSTYMDVDRERAHAAIYLEQQLLHLGIAVQVELTDLAGLQYAVYSSEKYDMAILGWRLSEYPDYLCEWFGAGGEFEYANEQLQSACGALAVESDLEAARTQVFAIQSILSEDLPFIPLYTNATYDAFQNVAYPFDAVPGGLSGMYGAPSHAIPAK